MEEVVPKMMRRRGLHAEHPEGGELDVADDARVGATKRILLPFYPV